MNIYVPRSTTRDNLYYRSRLFVNFPALMDIPLFADGQKLKFTQGEWIKMTTLDEGDPDNWIPETDSDPYFKNNKLITDSSAKLEEIAKGVKAFESTFDATRHPAKMIFVSYFFCRSLCDVLGKFKWLA